MAEDKVKKTNLIGLFVPQKCLSDMKRTKLTFRPFSVMSIYESKILKVSETYLYAAIYLPYQHVNTQFSSINIY